MDVPVVAVGKLGYPDIAEKAIRDGDCDMVMLARPLLADPDWCNKALPAMWRRSGRVSAVRKAALMSLFWEGILSVQLIREPDSRNVSGNLYTG